jgi:metallo-beta-lactamase class B
VKLAALAAVLALAAAQAASPVRADPPHKCFDCGDWNRPHEPFKVFGNTYYVGVDGLSAILITNGGGSILLDGGLSQSAPLIDQNIRKLGFRTEDIRLIVNSHAHFDHAGGIAALQRVSGATVAATADGKRALERGVPNSDDPQFAFGREANAFPAIANVRAVADGETLRVGDLAVVMHAVPGHTTGSAAWTWKACEAARCYDVVYADSLNAVSAPAFRFTGDATHPSRVPAFRKSIAAIRALPCDIILAVHPSAADLDKKFERRRQHPAVDPFVDAGACRAYADGASKRLDARIAEEGRAPGQAR